jgi:hypothetical protein
MSATATSPEPKFTYRRGDPARWTSRSTEWRVQHGDVLLGTIYFEQGVHDGEWDVVTPAGVHLGFATPRNAAAKLLYDRHYGATVPAAAKPPSKRTRKSRTARAAEVAAADAAARQPDGEATIVRDAEGLPQIARVRDAG